MTPAASSSAAQMGGGAAAVASSPFSVVALDIGGTKVAACIARYDGEPGAAPRLTARRSIPTEAARGGADVLVRVCALAAELVGEARRDASCPLAGVGVSSAGSIRESDGLIAFANQVMPGWMGQPLGRALGEACGCPVAVLNDVRAHALGELRHGAARGAEVALVVAVGTGLAGATVVDGHVLAGAHGFAGMFGHTLHPAAVGVPGPWKTTGNLESVVAGAGIERCYRLRGGEELSGLEISARANAGEPLACEVVAQSGHALGEAIASWADVLDPELVVVSGSVTKSGPVWRDALRAGLDGFLADELRGGLRIVDARLGDDAPLVGAAERLRETVGR